MEDMKSFILCTCLCLSFSLVSGRIGSVVYDTKTRNFEFQEGEPTSYKAVSRGNFTQSSNETGWSYLEITTNEQWEDSSQAYAAGYLEGVLTRDMIKLHWYNNIVGDPCVPDASSAYCQRLKTFINTNVDWLNSVIKANSSDPYWHQVKLFFQQLQGLEDGFNNHPSKYTEDINVNTFGLLLFQLDGDMEDLEVALKAPGKHNGRVLGSGRCSALIKILDGFKDLYVSHDTWSTYQSMLRILKKYDFGFHLNPSSRTGSRSVIPGRTMTFSSYPGYLLSGDDFYLISSGLATIETTIGNSNPDLYKKYIKPTNSVFECVRNMVANRLATTGREWAEMFTRWNSGTYNNEWMVVDYKRFTPGQAPVSDLLWVVEQIPGMVKSEDMTGYLKSTSHWPSYNLPYFKEVQVSSGIPEMVKKYGNFFSHENSPRAKIFRRDHSKVHDLDSMTRLMRYNDFKNDPYGKCKCIPPYSGENGISARCDLNPANGTYPISALGHREHGGTDMKLTDSTMFKTLQFRAISGPTANQQPPFQWSTSDFAHLPHVGHPDVFNFGPVTHVWNFTHVFPPPSAPMLNLVP